MASINESRQTVFPLPAETDLSPTSVFSLSNFLFIFTYFISFCEMISIYLKVQLLKFIKRTVIRVWNQSLSWWADRYLANYLVIALAVFMVKEALLHSFVCGTRWLTYIMWHFGNSFERAQKDQANKSGDLKGEVKRQRQIRSKQMREGSDVRLGVKHR